MNTIEEYILEVEKRLNVYQENRTKMAETFKDISDLTALSVELDEIIKELDQNYSQTKSIDDERKLNEYLNERRLYDATIQGMVRDYQDLKKNVDDSSLEMETASQLVQFFYKRKEILFKLEQIEKDESSLEKVEVSNYFGKNVYIPVTSIDHYQNLMVEVEELDEKICKVFSGLKENVLSDSEEYFYDVSEEVPLSSQSKADLEEEYQEILVEMQSIENSKGKKILFKATYQGQSFSKEIPKVKRYQYGMLFLRLKRVEEQLKLIEKVPPAVFDEQKYNSMGEMQQKTYVANLMLLIENLPRRLMMAYVNGHYIPLEYKTLYTKLVGLMNAQKKVIKSDVLAIDEEYVGKLPLEEQMNYYDDLAERIFKRNSSLKRVAISFQEGNIRKTYEIEEEYAQLFTDCHNRYNSIKDTLAKKVEEIKKDDPRFEQPQNRAYVLAIEEKLEVPIYFDETKYNSLSAEKQIVYCRDLLNEIILQTVVHPIEMNVDNQKVIIDVRYADPFTRASEKLMLFKAQNQPLDIGIDETYVKNLSKAEQEAYYLLLMHDISMKEVVNGVSSTVNGRGYRYDEKYVPLFKVVENRYKTLVEERRQSQLVQAKRKATRLERIRKSLKKKALQIGLAVSMMANVVSFGMMLDNSRTSKVSTTVVTDDIDSTLESVVPETIVIETDESVDSDYTSDTEELEATISNNYLGQNFVLQSDASVYMDYQFDKPYKPTFANDTYTTVGIQLQMPDGSLERVYYNDQDAQSIIQSALDQGAVVVGRAAVASSGMNDYLKNGVETGTFKESDVVTLDLNTDLQNVILDAMNQGRGL